MKDKAPVLVDTSVWIDYFRAGSPDISAVIDALIAEDRARICGIVVAELLQGAKTQKEVELLAEVGRTIKCLAESSAVWEKAGRLAYDLRRRGRTIHLIDCYLAELAIENNSQLFTLDRHFEIINEIKPLPLLNRF